MLQYSPTLFQVRNIYFNDGVRRIDYILAWNVKSKKEEESQQARDIFESNLIKEGLEIEHDLVGGVHLYLEIEHDLVG